MTSSISSIRGRWTGRRAIGLATLLLLLLQTSLGFVAAPADSDDGSSQQPAATGAVPAYRQANHVAVLTVHEPIDRVTLYSLERRLDEAIEDGCDAVVIDLDTPGGRMDATLDICNLIKTEMPANTVAWVNPQAYSAGSIIALACREIVVAPHARLGDAAPIRVAGGALIPLPAAERAKTESPLLSEVIDSARRNHYDEKLVQSFISVGVELWMLENVNTGQRVFVDRSEYTRIFGEDPPKELTAVAPPNATENVTAPPQQRVLPWINQRVPEAGQEELDPEDYQKSIERAQTLPPARPQLTSDDAEEWQLVMQAVSDDRLLTVNQDEAVYYGLATTVIANEQQLQDYFGAKQLTRYDGVWSEGLVRFLTHPVVMGVLIVIFIVCLFIELAAPGLGVFGGAALVALALLIGAPYLLGMAQWWDVLLILIGIALVLAELFLIPGVGVAGFGGAVCLLVGLVGVFVSGDFTTAQGRGDIVSGSLTVLTALFASVVGIWLISRYVHSIPIFDRLILKSEVGERQDAGGMLTAMAQPQQTLQAGDEGLTVTELRPIGRVEINGRHVEVRSAGPYIARGARVRVVHVGPFVIEVEEVSA